MPKLTNAVTRLLLCNSIWSRFRMHQTLQHAQPWPSSLLRPPSVDSNSNRLFRPGVHNYCRSIRRSSRRVHSCSRDHGRCRVSNDFRPQRSSNIIHASVLPLLVTRLAKREENQVVCPGHEIIHVRRGCGSDDIQL